MRGPEKWVTIEIMLVAAIAVGWLAGLYFGHKVGLAIGAVAFAILLAGFLVPGWGWASWGIVFILGAAIAWVGAKTKNLRKPVAAAQSVFDRAKKRAQKQIDQWIKRK